MAQSKYQNKQQIPLFVSKLFAILNTNEYSDIIQWYIEKKGFQIKNIKSLQLKILPIYFRHSNYTSFVRQLNMYDFHKVRLCNQNNIFYHPQFTELKQQMLYKIKRKCYQKNQNKQNEVVVKKQQNIHELIQNFIQTIKNENIEQLDTKQLKKLIYKKRKQPRFVKLAGKNYLNKIYEQLDISLSKKELEQLSIEQEIEYEDRHTEFKSLAFLNSERYFNKIVSIFNFDQ